MPGRKGKNNAHDGGSTAIVEDHLRVLSSAEPAPTVVRFGRLRSGVPERGAVLAFVRMARARGALLGAIVVVAWFALALMPMRPVADAGRVRLHEVATEATNGVIPEIVTSPQPTRWAHCAQLFERIAAEAPQVLLVTFATFAGLAICEFASLGSRRFRGVPSRAPPLFLRAV
jgi:hypothetical protein